MREFEQLDDVAKAEERLKLMKDSDLIFQEIETLFQEVSRAIRKRVTP